ncbi:MAG: hypothetical protein ACXWQR_19725 [Ktedonobacterales bacterium]
MHTDLVYEALHPFHLWAWIAAACAFALAAAAFAMLALSYRRSLRWWLGMGILAICLLTVAFGARSRGLSYDLRPIVADCVYRACNVVAPEVVAAQQQVEVLGIAVLVATVISLAAAAYALLRHHLPDGRLHLLAPAFPIAAAIVVAGFGAFWTTDGIKQWIEFAYLADITRAGDGLGQIPLWEAIVVTTFGVLVLAASLGVLIASSTPRRSPADADPAITAAS